MISKYDYIWYWRKRLPERKNHACRILARGKMNSILIEFHDGQKVVTSRFAVRKITPKIYHEIYTKIIKEYPEKVMDLLIQTFDTIAKPKICPIYFNRFVNELYKQNSSIRPWHIPPIIQGKIEFFEKLN